MRGSHRPSWTERLSDAWEKFWRCRINGDHLVKLDSHDGRCYICGKKVVKYL